jgi:hypothetical protein
MPFHWRDHDGQELERRYVDASVAGRELSGIEAWTDLLDSIGDIGGLEADAETTPGHERLLTIFEKFLDATDGAGSPHPDGDTPSSYPVVFVSHQRADVPEAERIAELALARRIDYWLDIHDPSLKLAGQTIRPGDARYPVIIAAIIEMALLNSSHLIAVHTTNSLASKWVPYELGRVRDRNIQSANAGGWFHPNLLPRQCGDYVHLCRIARGGEHEINRWLGLWAAHSSAPSRSWPGGTTTALP